jgi:hypothetical protein
LKTFADKEKIIGEKPETRELWFDETTIFLVAPGAVNLYQEFITVCIAQYCSAIVSKKVTDQSP